MAALLTHPLINDGWFIEKNGQWPGQGTPLHFTVAIATRTRDITRFFFFLQHSYGSQGRGNPSRWKVKVPGRPCVPIFQLWQCLGSWWCYSGYWTRWILVSVVVVSWARSLSICKQLIDTWIACCSYQEMITHLAMNSHPNPKKVKGNGREISMGWSNLIRI